MGSVLFQTINEHYIIRHLKVPYIKRKVKTTKLPFQRAPEQLCTESIIPLTGDVFQDTISSESIHWSIIFLMFQTFFLTDLQTPLCIEHGCSKPALCDTRTYLFTRTRVIATGKKKQEQKDSSSMVILHLLEHSSSSYFCFLKGQFWGWRKACVSALPAPTLHNPRLLLILVQTPL